VAAEEVERRVLRTRELTDRAFGANFVLAFPIEDNLARCLDLGVEIVSTAWGDPSPVRPRINDAGAIHIHVVGSVDEARRAIDAGVDVVVAQGWEAGGHVVGTTATLPLVPAVVDAVKPVPVIAAGGIADGRGLAAVLALGARAAWIGTRFLTASEAFTHDQYRRRVIEAGPEDAVYTTAFDGGWPEAPHRAIRNSTLTRWEGAGRPAAPQRPGEGGCACSRCHRTAAPPL
jgi:NAD(P)H-dependent flavin oxidoreductase YrpB (nitropropane dioxygenase family)